MKRPSFQFYPGDWLTDTALRCCSIGARGLWIDMICFMHGSSTYGHLKVNHKVIHATNLARMVGLTVDEVEGYISELMEAGVCQVDDEGCFFSKRMVKDENLRQIRAEGGKKGGNPSLMVKKEAKTRLTSEDKQNPTPSSSSSSSSSSVTKVTERAPAGAADPDAPVICTPDMMTEVSPSLAKKFIAHRKQVKAKGPFTVDAWNLLLRQASVADVSPEVAVQYAIDRGWQSFTATYYFNAERSSTGRAQPGPVKEPGWIAAGF